MPETDAARGGRRHCYQFATKPGPESDKSYVLEPTCAMGDTGHSANQADAAEFEGWALDVGA